MEIIPLNIRRDIFMQERDTAHFSAQVRELNANFAISHYGHHEVRKFLVY